LTKEPKAYIGEKTDFLTPGIEETGYPLVEDKN
jgi:hypothetical protein